MAQAEKSVGLRSLWRRYAAQRIQFMHECTLDRQEYRRQRAEMHRLRMEEEKLKSKMRAEKHAAYLAKQKAKPRLARKARKPPGLMPMDCERVGKSAGSSSSQGHSRNRAPERARGRPAPRNSGHKDLEEEIRALSEIFRKDELKRKAERDEIKERGKARVRESTARRRALEAKLYKAEALVRQQRKTPGAFNEYGSEGPWFAVDSHSGVPLDTSPFFKLKENDFKAAHEDRLDHFHADEGFSIVRTFGVVTVTYTCIKPATGPDSGNTWRVQYTTEEDKVVWFHRSYSSSCLRVYGSDVFTVPPS